MKHSEVLSTDIYHDIYDFSIFPISLGDVFSWIMKTSLLCRKANRSKLHIHLVGDAQLSGSSILLSVPEASVDLFIMELLPAFYSCPNLDGLTFHTSRKSFESRWDQLAENDPLALQIYQEHQSIYCNRSSVKLVLDFFTNRCAACADLNEDYRSTGTLPRLHVTPECLADVKQMKAAYPENTFWVTIHSRLSRLDKGLRSSVPENYFDRDASFLQWYRFLIKARETFPNVQFVLVGRLMEKPLALLKLPNVIAPRVLGMTLDHEIALIGDSHLFMGSIAGPAQMAIYSGIDYALFNCTTAACKNFDIPYGATHLPFGKPDQRLYYGKEDADLLFQVLSDRVTVSGLKAEFTQSATHRYFTSEAQGVEPRTELPNGRENGAATSASAS